jgi:hypothetical protein
MAMKYLLGKCEIGLRPMKYLLVGRCEIYAQGANIGEAAAPLGLYII